MNTDTTEKLTTGAFYLKRGDLSDPEDWRMGHRLTVARAALQAAGYVPEKTHSKRCQDERFVVPGYRTGCDSNCVTTWTGGELSNEVFNAAFAFACAVQDNRRAVSQAEINAARARQA